MGAIIGQPSELGAMQLNEFGSYDINEIYAAENDCTLYMSTPVRYIANSVARLSLTIFVVALISYRYFAVPLVPSYIILFFKIDNFCKWCSTVNLSYKKMMRFFVAETVLFTIAAIILQNWFVNVITAF